MTAAAGADGRSVSSSGRTAALQALSQVANSASNGLLVVLVARTSSPDELGRFSVALGLWLFIVGSFRAVFGQPLLILQERHRRDLRPGAETVALLYLTAASALSLAFATDVIRPFDGVPALFPLATGLALVQDAMRFGAFTAGRPGVALRSDVAWVVGQVAVLVALAGGGSTVDEVVGAWALGALVGMAVGPGLVAPRVGWRRGVGAAGVLWRLGSFIGAGSAAAMLAIFMSPVVLAFAGSFAVAGAFRLLETMIQPIRVVGIAIETDLLSGGFMRRRSVVLALAGVLAGVSALAVLWAPTISETVFVSDILSDRVVVGFSFAAVLVNTIALWPRADLKVSGGERSFAVIRAVSSAVYLGALFLGTVLGGIRGAACGLVVVALVELVVTWRVARRSRSREVEHDRSMSSASSPGGHARGLFGGLRSPAAPGIAPGVAVGAARSARRGETTGDGTRAANRMDRHASAATVAVARPRSTGGRARVTASAAGRALTDARLRLPDLMVIVVTVAAFAQPLRTVGMWRAFSTLWVAGLASKYVADRLLTSGIRPLVSRLPRAYLYVVAWSAASIVWSLTPSASAMRVLLLVATGVIVATWARRLGAPALEPFVWTLFGLVVASLVVGIVAPGAAEGEDGSFVGLFEQKNELGRVAGLAAIMAFAIGRSLPARYGAVAVCVATMVMADSVTALSATVVCIAALVALPRLFHESRRARLRSTAGSWRALVARVGLFGSVALMLVTIVAVPSDNWIFRLLGRGQEANTVEVRRSLWEQLFDLGMDRPLWGHGFGVSVLDERLGSAVISTGLYDTEIEFKEAHNGFLEMFLQVGAVGLVLVVVMLWSMWTSSVQSRTRPTPVALCLQAVIAYQLVLSVTAAVLLNRGSLILAALLLAFGIGQGEVAAPGPVAGVVRSRAWMRRPSIGVG